MKFKKIIILLFTILISIELILHISKSFINHNNTTLNSSTTTKILAIQIK